MFMYAVKKPAAAAAAALGEDGTAVFCEGPGLLFASARGETPDAGITTAIFNDVEKGDIHDGDRWFPGAGSIAEVVFDMPAPLGEKLAGRLEGSAFLIDFFRDKIASLGEECDVITGTNIHVGLPAQLEMPAPHAETKPSDEMRCPVLEIEPGEIRAPYIVAKEEAIRALRRAAYDVRPGCEETIGTYRGLSVVCRRQRVLDDDWLPYIGLAVDAARHVHMSDRVFPSGEKGAFTVLTQMDRIIARDAKGPAEIELKLRDAQLALADAQKAAKEPFPKQAELDEAEQRLAELEQERIEAEAQRQREQAQRAEAEAAAIEEGVEEERAAEREHERAAVADDEARWAGRVAELRRQGLICEDSATHAAATAAPNGIASGCPDDVAEAARCSAAASAREEAGVGEKHKAGM